MSDGNGLWGRYLGQRELARVGFERGSALVERWLRAWASPQWILMALLVGGLALRLWGLARPPLEFHPGRQFMGAAIARGYFLADRADEPAWRRKVAELNGRGEQSLEPTVLEYVAVAAYRLVGHEALWIPRALSVAFWILGAVFLYHIGVRLASPASALISVAVYLFMPFGILASRSFQPDPMMVCLQLAGIVGLLRFAECEGALRLLLAAALCAAAVFIKPVSLFVLLGVYGVGSLRRHGLLRTLTSRYTVLLGAALSLPVAFYLWKMFFNTTGSNLRGQAEGSILPALLLTGVFWRGLVVMLMRVIGIVPLLLALEGLTWVPEKEPHQGVLAGMWAGYAGFVLLFTYHTHTHDYYHLQLLPIAALSLGPLALAVVGTERRLAWLTLRRAAFGIVLLALAVCLAAVAVTGSRSAPKSGRQHIKSAAKACGAILGVPQKFVGYLRPASIGLDADVAAAVAAGESVRHSLNTVILGKDGGSAAAYLGEFSGERWPARGFLRSMGLRGVSSVAADERLRDLLRQNPDLEYFVVTDLGDLAQQPDLERVLATFPVVVRTPRYAVYSLRGNQEPTDR